jgi:hypothetical protein
VLPPRAKEGLNDPILARHSRAGGKRLIAAEWLVIQEFYLNDLKSLDDQPFGC